MNFPISKFDVVSMNHAILFLENQKDKLEAHLCPRPLPPKKLGRALPSIASLLIPSDIFETSRTVNLWVIQSVPL